MTVVHKLSLLMNMYTYYTVIEAKSIRFLREYHIHIGWMLNHATFKFGKPRITAIITNRVSAFFRYKRRIFDTSCEL